MYSQECIRDIKTTEEDWLETRGVEFLVFNEFLVFIIFIMTTS